MNVGLFIDADNLLPFWRSERILEFEQFVQAEDFRAILDQIEELVAAEGSVLVREAYGKWENRARLIPASMMYHDYGYVLQHVPPLSPFSSTLSLKNAGDILLASRAILASVSTYVDLDTVVIAASDNDYQPLVVELKRLGKRVVMLSFPILGDHQRALLTEVFDEHLPLTPVARWAALYDAQNQRTAPRIPRDLDNSRLPNHIRPREPESTTAKSPEAVALALWGALDAGTDATGVRAALTRAGVERKTADALGQKLIVDQHIRADGDRRLLPDGADIVTWGDTVVEALIVELARSAATNLGAELASDTRTTALRSAVLSSFTTVGMELMDRVARCLALHAAEIDDRQGQVH